MRNLLAAVAAALTALTVTVPQPVAAHLRPEEYVVSTEPGVLPEGIAVAADGTMYVTSSATGAVYRGHVREPLLRPFLPPGSDGRTRAAGVHLDRRGRLFVAGYDTGMLFVYAADGTLLARRTAPGAALNDLAITDDAVYVTDSAAGVLWRAALDGASVGKLTPWLAASDFPAPPGFLNGIVATDGGRIALVADQGTGAPGTGRLYRVDLRGRTASVIAVTGGRLDADGLLLEGNRLYGVVNAPTDDGGVRFAVHLAVLGPDRRTARVVRRSLPAPAEQTPTTLARDGGRLLWVNSQLAAAAPAPPFTVTPVPGLR